MNDMTAATASRPSTRLGDLLGWVIIRMARLADYWIPLAGIRVYQCIPAGARGRLFGGPPGSREVTARIRAAGGGGWNLMARWMMSNHPDRPVPGS